MVLLHNIFLTIILILLPQLTYQLKEIFYYERYVNNVKFYYYNSKYYITMKSMALRILQDFRMYHPLNLFIKNMGVITDKDIKIKKYSAPEPILEYLDESILPKKCVIMKITNKFGTKFKCMGRVFTSYEEANKYALEIEKLHDCKNYVEEKVVIKNVPKNLKAKPLIPPKPLCLIHFNPAKCLFSNMNSFNTWKHVWNQCNFKCLFEKTHHTLKQKMLSEINCYRTFHSSKALIRNPYLEKIAQERADMFSHNKYIIPDKSKLVGEFYVSLNYELLRYLIKFWYDEGVNYNYNAEHVHPATQHFTALIWKGTSIVGIGISRSKDTFYAVFLFSPKGNTPNAFKRNVFDKILNYV
ncbi:CAP domain-containing protein [Strongyloides ratti]|uniref:CAP domain-containing protein n=1 Tax=Strongyloides ratti TaxID=34506 RepID=A0A090LQS3_STRRB|nr:CAP domain-containing protein [Strongyloides ratti]CEF69936.2 CAP domain-containing protein [Strongyloides ratti]